MNKFLRKNSHIIVWIVVFAFLVGGVLLGYGSYVTRGGESNNTQSQEQPNIAKVNSEVITAADYWNRIQAASQYLSSIPADQQLMYRYRILSDMIDNTLTLQEAKKMDVEVTVADEDIQEQVDNVLEKYEMTQKELEEQLEKSGMTMAQWKDTIRESLREQKRIQVVMDKVTKDVTVEEEEIIEEYEKVRVRRIVIPKNGEVENPKAKIEEAKSKLEEGGSFDNIAKEYSSSYEAAQGGDVGFIGHNGTNLGKKVTKQVFEMEVGKISDIIEDEKAYNIVKVTDKKHPGDGEYAEKKEEIRKKLFDSKKLKAKNDWSKGIKEEAEIVITYPHLAGYKAFVDKDFETAVNKFEEVIQQNENSPYYSYLARAYKELGNLDKAIEVLKTSVEVHPEDWQSQLILADLYKSQDMDEEAIAAYKEVSKKADGNRWIHTRLAEVFQEYGLEELAAQEEKNANDIISQQRDEALKRAQDLKKEDDVQKNELEDNKEESSNE